MNNTIEKQLKEERLPIFIWGAGAVGTLTNQALKDKGIYSQGYVVDVTVKDNKEIWNKQSLLQEYREYVLVRGFWSRSLCQMGIS